MKKTFTIVLAIVTLLCSLSASATVTDSAGKILGGPELLDYGRDRIRRNLDHYREVGGFNEYNSPTYTMVVVHEPSPSGEGNAKQHYCRF